MSKHHHHHHAMPDVLDQVEMNSKASLLYKDEELLAKAQEERVANRHRQVKERLSPFKTTFHALEKTLRYFVAWLLACA